MILCLSLCFSSACGGSPSSSSSTTTTSATAETVGITAQSGSAQSTAGGKPFSAPFVVTVTTNGVLTEGEKVTFTAPASGASGTFANGSATESDITNSVGVATSSAFTANSTGGSYAVTASASGASTPASFALTNIASTSYAFFLSGQEYESGFYYAVAGSVVVDSNGNVLGGEQDFNDSPAGGFSSPEPGGDTITGGSLVVDPTTGQGTLSLTTNNLNLGLNADGTEVFGVQFVNGSHALLMQYDGAATSSGTMDLQTLPGTVSGNYAFTLSGVDANFSAVDFGGIFSVSGTALTGTYDVNDPTTGLAKLGTAIKNGKITTPDAYGRGTITGITNSTFIPASKIALVYYVVGPEAIRLVDVDSNPNFLTDSAGGSAFGQGASTFTNASLVTSVLAISGNMLDQFAALGQFTPTSSSATFTGVGDDSEPINGVLLTPQAVKNTGIYSIASNGYGNFTFNLNSNNQGLGNITNLGLYMTDPALNLNDPNNPIGGGGALIVDLDDGSITGYAFPGGTGVIVPQTDAATATTDFAGSYAAAWQNYNANYCSLEFDMIAQGAMTEGGSLSLTGLVSDPFGCLGTPDQTSSGDTFTGIPAPDTKNPGRYAMTATKDSLKNVVDGVTGSSFQMIVYQASGQQLFWLGYDLSDATNNGSPAYVSLGPLEQQSLTNLPMAKKAKQRKK